MPPAVAQEYDDWYSGHPERLPPLVRKLESSLTQERFIDGAITRLYYGQGILPVGMAASVSTVPLASMFLRALDAFVEENVLASVLDAAVSMVVRKPAFKVITSGGTWKKTVASRRMSRLLSGLDTASGRENVRTAVVLDSMRCQVAGAKCSISPTGKLRWERCLPHTLIWNQSEGTEPRNLYERHGVPRSRILRMFKAGKLDGLKGVNNPERTIANLPAYRPDPAFHIDTYSYTADQDLVEVVEGHRKAEDDDPGRHVMMSGTLELADEEWDLPFWPIVPLTWGSSYDSLAGYPLGRRVLSFQRTIQRMDATIDEAQSLACPPTLLVPKGSEVTGWNNKIGKRVDYVQAAGKPEIVAGQALAPEYYNRFSQKKSSAYELAGVAQNIASGTKEAGLNSGKAQRDRYDIANSRLVDNAKQLERWDGECGRVGMGMMRKAYNTPEKRKAAPNTALLQEIDWSAIGDVKEDEVQVRAYITSAIPVEPAGRAETLAEWVNDGVLSQRRAIRWYADPDTAKFEDDEAALEDLCLKMIDSCLADCKYIPPEPVMGPEGLGLLVDLGGKELMKALTMPEEPPEANVELLRRLIEEAKLLMTQPGAPGDTSTPPAQLTPPPPGPGEPPPPAAPPPAVGGPPLPAPAPPS